jgi:hypothetical protein
MEKDITHYTIRYSNVMGVRSDFIRWEQQQMAGRPGIEAVTYTLDESRDPAARGRVAAGSGWPLAATGMPRIAGRSRSIPDHLRRSPSTTSSGIGPVSKIDGSRKRISKAESFRSRSARAEIATPSDAGRG